MRLGPSCAARGRGFSPPNDLRQLPSSSSLAAWWDAGQGVTMSATLLATGTSPPAVTLSGALTNAAAKAIYLQVNKADATKFDWNDVNGWGLSRGVGEMGVTIPQGGSYILGSTGLTAAFPSGTYGTSQVWQAGAESWAAIVGGASMLLDNSSVYAAKGPVIENLRGFNDLRPSLRFSSVTGTGGLGNTSGVPALATGTNTPFHIFTVCQITSSGISTLPVALWGFNHSTTTTGNYLDARWYGPLATVGPAGVGAQHFIQRRAAGDATVPKGYLTDLSFGPCIIDYGYDGTTVEGRINGQLMFSQAWSSNALTLQRFLLCAQKLGTSAVSNIAFARVQALAMYTSKQAENDNGAWGIRRALA